MRSGPRVRSKGLSYLFLLLGELPRLLVVSKPEELNFTPDDFCPREVLSDSIKRALQRLLPPIMLRVGIYLQETLLNNVVDPAL